MDYDSGPPPLLPDCLCRGSARPSLLRVALTGSSSPCEDDELLLAGDGGGVQVLQLTEMEGMGDRRKRDADVEPFPVMPMIAVTVIVACDNIAFTQIFPYLGYLIIYLGLAKVNLRILWNTISICSTIAFLGSSTPRIGLRFRMPLQSFITLHS